MCVSAYPQMTKFTPRWISTAVKLNFPEIVVFLLFPKRYPSVNTTSITQIQHLPLPEGTSNVYSMPSLELFPTKDPLFPKCNKLTPEVGNTYIKYLMKTGVHTGLVLHLGSEQLGGPYLGNILRTVLSQLKARSPKWSLRGKKSSKK